MAYTEYFPIKAPAQQTLSATVAKFYTAASAAIGAAEVLYVHGIAGSVTVAEAGGKFTFSDEDGTNIFFALAIDVAGPFSVNFDPPKCMPVGKDVKVTAAGVSTGRADVDLMSTVHS